MTVSVHPYHSAPRFVYALSGPSGTYIGCTKNPEQRERAHFVRARGKPNPWRELAVHRAMRSDGVDQYSFSLLLCAAGSYNGRLCEVAMIHKLRSQGVRVLNVYPLARRPAPAVEGQG